MPKIGIIGGSGIYKIEGIKALKDVRVRTLFGDPRPLQNGAAGGSGCRFSAAARFFSYDQSVAGQL
jgi:purine nucleoside phosphorylase